MHLDDLLLAALILLAITAMSVSLFTRIGLGSVIGFLAAGMLVGPSGLGITREVEALRGIAELGVVLLLFLIGLEMQPRKLWSMRRAVFGLGSAQVVVTGAAIALYISLFAEHWQLAVLLGLGLSLSSTAFALKILGEQGALASEHGQAAFAVLLMQDLAIVPLLALVPFLSPASPDVPGSPVWRDILVVMLAIGGVIVVGRVLIPRALRRSALRRNTAAFGMYAMLSVLAAAYIMGSAGLSMALGGFMMGMLLSASDYRHQIDATVAPFKQFLLGLFFISVGMSIDMNLLMLTGFAVAVHVGIILLLKTAILFGLCRAFGLSVATALRTAFLLSQCGEFGFVLFAAAMASGMLSAFQFAVAILSISVSMVATPLMVRLGDLAAARVAAGTGDVAPSAVQPPDQAFDRHVIVAGHGQVGSIVTLMLQRRGIPYVAFDLDAERVRAGRAAGRTLFYGDISDARVLEAAGVGRAAALVVSLGAPQLAERIVLAARALQPEIAIFARVRDLELLEVLKTHGVRQAVPVAAEGGLLLGRLALESTGVPRDDARDLVESLRQDGNSLLRAWE